MRFFSAVCSSATDFSFYRQIVRQKLSQTVVYFLLLLFSAAVVLTGFYYFYVKRELEYVVEWSQKHLPHITIRKGHVSSPVEQPYKVQEKDFAFFLDTTGVLTRLDPQVAAGVLVLKDRVFFKRPGLETQDMPLHWVKELDVDAQKVTQWKDKAVPLLGPFLFVTFLVGLVFSKTLQALLFSMLFFVFSNSTITGLQFKELFNLSVYALTPPTLLGVFVQILQWDIAHFFWIYFFLYGAFMVGAFLQCRKIQNKENELF